MYASTQRLCAWSTRLGRGALCAALVAVFLPACSKTTIDPARYGQSNGQYAQPAAPVAGQSGTLQETTLSEAPAAPVAPAPAGVASVPIVAAQPAQPYYDPYAAPAAPAPVAPAPPAPSGRSDGPFAPSAEEELAALRSASQAPPAPAAPPAPRPAAGTAAGATVYQLQAFLDRTRAQAYRDQLAAKGHDVFFEEALVNGQQYTRVLIRLHGTEQERRGVLNGLGAPDARPRRAPPPAAPAPVSQTVPLTKPAAVPIAATTATAASVATVPGSIPVVTPPAQPVPAAPAVPAARPSPAAQQPTAAGRPECQVTATHLQTAGVGLPGAGSPLMIEKQAREDATRNLLLCVDTYRKERGQVPQHYTMQADIPPGLLQVGDVDLQPDGSVRAVMRIRLADLPQLDVQVLD
ncbi:SPOR domain-containing protein [Megalodesulfovibrio gigas]|nr:hypothetical protein [Megalodesulfovibrio gigas]